MVMGLEDYIKKYGELSGTKRFLGVQKSEKTKKEKYAKQPYKRLTKEWFVWRYPENGLERFEEFAGKSAHTIENFIRKYGEVEGRKKYQDTVEKKDTVALLREKYSDKADAMITKRYEKQQDTMNAKSIEEKNEINKKKSIGIRAYNEKHVKGKKRIDRLIEKYGKEEGTQRYHKIMKKSFAGPCRMSVPALKIYKELGRQLPIDVLDRLYCDIEGKQEFWLLDKEDNKLFSYDFTDRKSKTILEYNGTFWHPEEPSDDLHPVTKQTLTEMYNKDKRKIELAKSNGFEVIIILESMDNKEQKILIDSVVSRIIHK